MYKEIKVSIIIPVYNSQKHIVECLNSIVGQSLKEIEIICINDGSTDNSERIIKSYKNSCINLYSKKNEGAGKARNYGIEKAKGKYIAFMDPDDLYASTDVLEKMYEAAEVNQAMICGGNILNFYEGELPYLTETYSKYHIKEEGFKLSKEYQNPWGHTKYLFRKEFLDKNQIRYPEYRRGEDPVFMINALAAVEKLFLIPITVYHYRQYKNRERFSSKIIIELLEGYLETIRIAKEKNNTNAFLDCVSQLEYWYNYIGFSEWENEYFWKLIDSINKEVISGSDRMNTQYQTKNIWRKEDVEQSIEVFGKYLIQAKEASKKNKLVIYGAGMIAREIMNLFERVGIEKYEIVVSNNENKQIIKNRQVQYIHEFKNKKDYMFFIAVASEKVQKEIEEILYAMNIENIIKINVDRLINMNGMSLQVEKLMRNTNV